MACNQDQRLGDGVSRWLAVDAINLKRAHPRKTVSKPFTILKQFGLQILLVICLLLAPLSPAFASSSLDSAASEAIHVVGRLPLQMTPAEQKDFLQRTLALAAVTRQQDQVVFYSCNEDVEHPEIFVFDEIWPSQAVFEAHLAAPHFQEWWSWVEPHLAGELQIEVAPVSSFHLQG